MTFRCGLGMVFAGTDSVRSVLIVMEIGIYLHIMKRKEELSIQNKKEGIEAKAPLHKSSNGLADGKIRLKAKINF